MQIAADEVGAPGVGSDPDAVLALRARSDPEAFGLLYSRYASRVISYFLLRTGSREDAEDLASQVFVQAFEALPRFRAGKGTVRSWLFAIAHNLSVSHYRSRQVMRPIDTIDLYDSAPSLEERAVQGDDLRRLRSALATLTDEQRRVIELRLAGLSGTEISRAAGKSYAAVKMLQHRALDQLRLVLAVPLATGEASHER
jgi:RNA polymerase sigma-70 factor (ECF subfamily)